MEAIIIIVKRSGSVLGGILGVLALIALINLVVGGSSTSPAKEPEDIFAKTALLFDLPCGVIDEGGIKSLYKSNEHQPMFDVDSVKHTTYNHLLCDRYDEPRKRVVIGLEGKYASITGKLYAQAEDNYCWLEFYDENNNFLGSSAILSGDNTSCSVNINITGVNDLTVYLRSKSGAFVNGWIISELKVVGGSAPTPTQLPVVSPNELFSKTSLLFDLSDGMREVGYIKSLYKSNEISSRTSVDGTIHTTYNYLLCDRYDAPRKKVVINLGGEYLSISGRLFAPSENAYSWLEFYDENNRYLGASEVITEDNPSSYVYINVTGVNQLTVYLRSKSGQLHNAWLISELKVQ